MAQRDEEERYDRALFDRMGALGLTGLPYPEQYGGAGLGTFPWVLACEEIAAADMGMAVSLSVHVLAQLCILSGGTDEQKERLLPPMTAGTRLGAFALTEPQAGSDAAALGLRAERDGDDYLLSGSKVWITNGAHADVVIVFGTVDRSLGREGITAFAVESDTPGFRVGSHERKMGIRDSVSAELIFDGARVPAINRLGEEGTGLKLALSALGVGRIGIAAACVGLARAALEHAARYATQRSQFGRSIADQEMVQAMLADAATAVEAARLLTWRAARMRDAGQPDQRGQQHGQAVCLGHRHARGHRRGADLWRRGLQPRQSGRAVHARRQGRADLRGDEPDPATHRGPAPDRGGAPPRLTIQAGRTEAQSEMSTPIAPAESAAPGAGRRMITDVEPLTIPQDLRAESLVDLVNRTVQRYPDKEALRWKLPRSARQMGGTDEEAKRRCSGAAPPIRKRGDG